MSKRGAASHKQWHKVELFVKTSDAAGLANRIEGAIEKDELVDDFTVKKLSKDGPV